MATSPPCDSTVPDDVEITHEAPPPVTDATLGIAVAPPALAAEPKHRLVTLGDSLTMGFQSFAIFNTGLSYPALIARELGWYDQFAYPVIPTLYGGLPLNLEFAVRQLAARLGDTISWWELPQAAIFGYHLATQISTYWETGAGSVVAPGGPRMHNLAVAGYDVRDLISRTADTEKARMAGMPQAPLNLVAANSGPLMGLYVLESARGAALEALSPVEAAAALGADGGIETLIVSIGANNALGTMCLLQVCWSQDDYADPLAKSKYTVWRPTHFAAEMAALMSLVDRIDARLVIWATVPHVTIVPLAHGIDTKVGPGSRYFPYYTRPWITDARFDPSVDAAITADQARAIDSAIDQYNASIVDGVRQRRLQGRDWRLLDTCGLMDRLAARRYQLDEAARPDWWQPYPLPPGLAALHPVPDSQFFAAGPRGRTAGGLFSLDGVHPTTIAYGLMAQEYIRVMEEAGIVFRDATGAPRQGPIQIDFAALALQDELITSPPAAVTSDLAWIGWANQLVDWAGWLRKISF